MSLGPRADPAGEDRRVADLAGVAAQRARHAHADAGDAARVGADLVEQLAHEPAGERDAVARGVVDVDGLLGLGEDGVGEVGDRDPDVREAEVDADRDARGAA
jgi:hypothetical protein